MNIKKIKNLNYLIKQESKINLTNYMLFFLK